MAEKILTDAVKLFEEKMAQGKYTESAKIREDYSIPADMLQGSVEKEYHRLLRLGEHSIAADLAKDYALPDDLARRRQQSLFRGRWITSTTRRRRSTPRSSTSPRR